jgi:hypothetical protein
MFPFQSLLCALRTVADAEGFNFVICIIILKLDQTLDVVETFDENSQKIAFLLFKMN